jgi:hypothetical protein
MARVVFELVITLAVHGAIAWSLHRWGCWVARRRGGLRWRYAAVLPVGGFWLAVIGIVFSTFILVRAWQTAGNATDVAEAVSASLNATATLAALSAALYVTSLVAFTVGTLRRAR